MALAFDMAVYQQGQTFIHLRTSQQSILGQVVAIHPDTAEIEVVELSGERKKLPFHRIDTDTVKLYSSERMMILNHPEFFPSGTLFRVVLTPAAKRALGIGSEPWSVVRFGNRVIFDPASNSEKIQVMVEDNRIWIALDEITQVYPVGVAETPLRAGL